MKKNFNQKFISLAALLTLSSVPLFANDLSTFKATSSLKKPSDVYNGPKNIAKHKIKKVKTAPLGELEHNFIIKPIQVKDLIISIDGVDKDATSTFNNYVGMTISSKDLEMLLKKVTEYYISKDFLLPKVRVSKASLSKGIIDISVKPMPIDEIVIVGEGEDNELVKAYADKIVRKSPAKISYVQRYLALMNELPGIEVQYQLKENNGVIELALYTLKKKWSFYAGADSYGTNNLGQYQAAALVQAYSPFNKNESLVLHGSTTNHPNRFNDIGFDFSLPINTEGTLLHLAASHSQDNPTKKDTVEAKTNQGNNFRLAFTHHILIKADMDLEGEAGLVYKDIKTNQVINNVNVPSKESRFWMGDIGFKYLFKDKFNAKDMFTIAYLQGLGGSFKNYDSDPINNKKFSIVRLNFFREQPLFENFELFNHVSLSYSANNLPDAEKSTLGGREFGRGYGFAVLDGSKFAAIESELRYNFFFSEDKLVHKIQPYLFHDFGSLANQDSNTTINKLESSGFGIRFKTKHDINFGAEAAFPFKKNYVVDGTSYKAKTNYSFFINKIFEY